MSFSFREGSDIVIPPVDVVGARVAPFVRPDNPVVPGGSLWLRAWKLSIGDPSGSPAIDLSGLAFNFNIERAMYDSPPTHGEITIFNPPDKVLNNLKQLTMIYLEAGYTKPSKQYGQVLAGQITWYEFGRKSATDTFLTIHAQQSDQAVNGTVLNTYLDAGYTKADVLKACADAMAGISVGFITPTLPTDKSPRGRVLLGMARDVLRDTAHTTNTQVFIDKDGYLHCVAPGEFLANANDVVPVLNSKSGLIGIPHQTMDQGVEIKSLLNPAIAPGKQVFVKPDDVARRGVNDTNIGGVNPDKAFPIIVGIQSVMKDGYYLVYKLTHSGENRGNAWYTDIVTEPMDPTKMQPAIGAT